MRNICITGGNSGLGVATAEYFLTHDDAAIIWLGLFSKRERAENLQSKFLGRVHLLSLDVTKEQAWIDAVAKIQGGIHVLVNNAGIHDDHLLAQMPDSSWLSVISTNLHGAHMGCKVALPSMMRAGHGRIINISSLSAVLPRLGQTNYAAAKAGLNALTQSLAKEVARMGITVNAIMPGFIETEALVSLDAEALRNAKREIPMRRFGKPSEIAAAIYFLASSEASYITGSILKIDGGIL